MVLTAVHIFSQDSNDLLLCLDVKPLPLPSVLRKSMLVGGYHMTANVWLSQSMIYIVVFYPEVN